MAKKTNNGNDNYDIFCSFCGRYKDEVGKMIAGPNGIFICEDCIDICNKIILEDLIEEEDLENILKSATDDEIKIVYSDGSYGRYFVHQSSSGNRVVFYGGEKDIDSVTSNAKHLYICNKEIPRYAYYINDGVGKYIWRDIVKESEISQDSDIYNRTYANGAIYITPNINF